MHPFDKRLPTITIQYLWVFSKQHSTFKVLLKWLRAFALHSHNYSTILYMLLGSCTPFGCHNSSDLHASVDLNRHSTLRIAHSELCLYTYLAIIRHLDSQALALTSFISLDHFCLYGIRSIGPFLPSRHSYSWTIFVFSTFVSLDHFFLYGIRPIGPFSLLQYSSW